MCKLAVILLRTVCRAECNWCLHSGATLQRFICGHYTITNEFRFRVFALKLPYFFDFVGAVAALQVTHGVETRQRFILACALPAEVRSFSA